ncbi:MAG: SpoIIE family protein phosphatase [Bacteroidia bacterium]
MYALFLWVLVWAQMSLNLTELTRQAQEGTPYQQVSALRKLAEVYASSGEFVAAKEALDRALALTSSLKDTILYLAISHDYATLATEQGQWQKAETLYHEVFLLAQKIGDIDLQATTLNNLFWLYENQNQKFKQASLMPQLNRYATITGSSSQAGILYTLGFVELEKGNYKQAEAYLAKAEAQAISQKEYKLLRDIAFYQTQIALRQRAYREAFQYYQKFVAYRDSVWNIEKAQEVARQAAFLQYQQEKQTLQEKNRLLRRERNLLTFVVGILGILVVGIGILSYTVYRQRNILRFSNSLIREVNASLQQKQRALQEGLAAAAQVQASFLTEEEELQQFFPRSSLLSIPHSRVTGDFVWVYRAQENVFWLAVGDCTGHGVQGALLTVGIVNILYQAIREYELDHPSEVLYFVHQQFNQLFQKSDTPDGAEMALLRIHKNAVWEIEYSGAHLPLFIHTAEGIQNYPACKDRIGYGQTDVSYETQTLSLHPGERLYLFSDGTVDTLNSQGKRFSRSRLKKFLLHHSTTPVRHIAPLLRKELEAHKGTASWIDDVTFVAIEHD